MTFNNIKKTLVISIFILVGILLLISIFLLKKPVLTDNSQTEAPPAGLVIYYVSSSKGNDALDGRSPDNTWKTLSKVSQQTFNPGDTILLKCGDIWQGEELLLNGHGKWQDNKWITLSSYGTGAKPVIKSPPGDTDPQVIYGQPNQTRDSRKSVKVAVKLKNAEGWKIKGIEISNAEQGIIFSNEAAGSPPGDGSTFDGFWIEDCHIHDITGARIWNYMTDVAPYAALVKSFPITNCLYNNWQYSNVTIKDCIIEKSDHGIWILSITNLLVDGVFSYGLVNGGNGFVGIEGGKIQNMTVYHTGYGATDLSGIAATGFAWCNTHSDNVVTMSNVEVADTKDDITNDGVAFDFECGCKNITLTDCYFHDNDGSAFLYYDNNNGFYERDLTIKNSIFENNGRKNPALIPAFLRYYMNEAGQISGNKIVRMPGQSTNSIFDNLILNGHFADGEENWTLTSASVLKDPTLANAVYQPDIGYLSISSGSSSNAKQTIISQVAEGRSYGITLWYKYSSTLTGTPGKAEVKFKDIKGEYISIPIVLNLNTPDPSGGYIQTSANFATPTGTAGMEVVISNGDGAPTLHMDGIRLNIACPDENNLSERWPAGFDIFGNEIYDAGYVVLCPIPPSIAQVNIAVYRSPKVKVSSGRSSAVKIRDGITGKDGEGEWTASPKDKSPWIKLDWGRTPHTIDRIRLFDRRSSSSWIQCGRLTFSDGSSINVTGGIMNNGAMREVIFEHRDVTWVKFEVTRGEDKEGTGLGLSEFEVYEFNPVFSSEEDFGNDPKQGSRGWHYEMYNGKYIELPQYDEKGGHWKGKALVGRKWQQLVDPETTGGFVKAVRTWEATCSGTITISGSAGMPDQASAGMDGVNAQILNGDSKEAIKTAHVTNTASQDMSVASVNVKAGDRLHFVLDHAGRYSEHEWVVWEPVIMYIEKN